MEVELNSFTRPSDISFDTLQAGGVTYHLVSAAGFTGSGDGSWAPGHPSLPSSSTTILLPPDTRVDSLEITEEAWEQLPGKYLLFPRQSGLTGDTLFVPPDPDIYSAETVYPSSPVSVTRQGSALGYSVATLTTTPVRYVPYDSTLMVLTSAEAGLHTAASGAERLTPARESVWSGEMRSRGIAGLVSNPEDTSLYRRAAVESFSGTISPLSISPSPSQDGNCVDLLIITGSQLEEAFTEMAEYRTSRGVVTAVRTVEWIDLNYSGFDPPQRIRNFIRDAHVHWGIQAVLLGGDDHIVPVRQCNGWAYNTYPFPTYQMPSDDYYGDIDGDWSAGGGLWSVNYQNSYLDLCVGRWPVDDPDDVSTMLQKLTDYEDPEDIPPSFARRLLMMGSNDICGTGADDMIELRALLDSSSAVPRYLDEPTELYFPHTFPAGNLCRAEALEEFDAGYNLILHADHSETHKLATAGKNTLGQYMWDSDFATMGNESMPSILWTLGCGPGHFDGADCYAEAGLINARLNGLVAAIANARYGLFNQKVTYFVFMDALFNTGYVRSQYGIHSPHWPLSYLGEAHRMSKNTDGISFVLLNLLGPPLLNVWRDDPVQLQLSVPSMVLVAGVPADIGVTVTDGSQPVAGVTVCLWKRDEIFSIGTTDILGRATFADVMAKYGGEGEALTVTAVKHRSVLSTGSSTVVSFLPDRKQLDVLPVTVPVLSMESYSVEDRGDGQPNPGEHVELLVTAANSGGETASDIRAELELVSGGQYIESVPDPSCCFPDISAGSLSVAEDPFAVKIGQNVESWSVAEFLITFTCSGSAGTYQWSSPLYLTVRSDEYQLTVMDPRADNSGQKAVVVMNDMLLVNSGLGEGMDLRVTVDNVHPAEMFLADTIYVPGLSAGGSISLEDGIVLNVFPNGSHSNWMEEGFPRCSFDVVVISRGNSSIARTVDVSLVSMMQAEQPQPPVSVEVYETGQNEISLVWDRQGPPYPESFYAYIYDGMLASRIFPLPVPVRQITVDGLSPGTEYQIGITSIDSIGRESEPATISATTPRQAIQGWPLQLAGSAGGGPIVADIDGDGMNEIVAATSFGKVYIIERNGTSLILSPPPDFDFDRFLGCAAGDVDGDSRMEIVATCQKHIDVEGEERIGVLLYNRTGFFWTVEEIAQTMVNQQAASPAVAGTPVLLQADGGASLEIAMRARGHFGTPPHLYLWRMDPSTGQWEDFGPQFPLSLIGSFYNSPAAVDFDGDGLEELLVTSFGTEGAGTAIRVVDFREEGTVSITSRDLIELDREGYVSRVYGTLAVAEENGDFYVAGAASTPHPAGDIKRLFAYRVTDGPTQLQFSWASEWMCGSDFYGNMPGPSIGDVDEDSSLELVYLLNGGFMNMEGFLTAWDLSTGEQLFQSEPIPFNPIIEEGGHYISTQPAVGLTSSPGPGPMLVFSGYSSLFCGHSPHSDPAMMEGFPSWSRDGGWSAPVICDLNGDGLGEVLHVDYSGMATLYDMGGYFHSADGWHMYQSNPHRNGVYNRSRAVSELDIEIVSVYRPREAVIGGNYSLSAVVEISGAKNGLSRDGVAVSSSAGPFAERFEDRCNAVAITAFLDGRPAGSAELELRDGTHTVTVPLGDVPGTLNEITLTADPTGEYSERDRSNNSFLFRSYEEDLISFRCHVPSPSEAIRLMVESPVTLPRGLSLDVYSLDGRLVHRTHTEDLPAGVSTFTLDTGPLPEGVYTILVRGSGTGDLVRRAVILSP